MSGHPKIDQMIAAGGGVVAADQIMQAVRDHKDHHPQDATAHYVKAAIAGAVAIGAYEMLKKDEGRTTQGERVVIKSDEDEIDIEEREQHHGNGPHHGRHLLEEALGAYALGRQMMGHKDHPLIKLVAEALGAAGLYQEATRDLE